MEEEAILDFLCDSEFEGDDSDDDTDEISWEEVVTKRKRIGAPEQNNGEEEFEEDIDEMEEDFEGFSDEIQLGAPSSKRVRVTEVPNVEEQWNWTSKEDIKWQRITFQKPSFVFEAEIDDFGEPLSPLSYFLKYVPDTLFVDMAIFTNLYAHQTNVKKWKETNKLEIKKFIAMHIMMGIFKLPRIKMYWDKDFNLPIFSENMTLGRFYQLRTNFHLMDVESITPECSDKFVRVRPIMNSVRNRCLQLPLEQYLSVDEQIIPCRGKLRKGVRQYVKQKPKIKWGIKNQVLCGKSGLAYDFVLYQGSTTEFNPKHLDSFGLGATIVLHLAKRIDKPGHELFFDNYFSTFALFEILAQKQIYAAGTIRLDRFSKPPFESDAIMKKRGRGSADEVASGSVTCVKWYDNKCVSLASNYLGIGKCDKASRYDKSKNKTIEISRPEIVRNYNTYMGGVDLLNQMISYYRIYIRSKKWTLRVITHFIDFALVNSWIEYKIDCEKSGASKREIMDCLMFRTKVIQQLLASESGTRRQRLVKKDNKAKERSPDDWIRYDGQDHLAKYSEARLRCKLKSCDSKSQIICSKCKVHLCINNHNDCFYAYHTKN